MSCMMMGAIISAVAPLVFWLGSVYVWACFHYAVIKGFFKRNRTKSEDEMAASFMGQLLSARAFFYDLKDAESWKRYDRMASVGMFSGMLALTLGFSMKLVLLTVSCTFIAGHFKARAWYLKRGVKVQEAH